jgi:Fe-S cluster assembly protein SufB
MSTATETIEGLVKQEYKYGFFTDVETESAPPGLRGHHPAHLDEEKEPEWMTDGGEAYRHWLTMSLPDWRRFIIRRNLGITYYPLKAERRWRRAWTKSIQLLETTRKLASRCANATLAGVGGRRLIACRSAPRSKSTGEKGVIFVR